MLAVADTDEDEDEDEDAGLLTEGLQLPLLPQTESTSSPIRQRKSVKMPDIQLESHTLRSHGTQVARFHMHDWIILILLAVIDGCLNIIEPFHRFVGQGMMTDLMYPLKGNTVPFWAVPVIAILLPFAIIIAIYIKKQNVYDLHNAILGLFFSVLITGVLTDAIKDAVGRPRPDFFWRCFPDGNPLYDNKTTGVICHGDKSVIKEGHKSFPSGHSSWAPENGGSSLQPLWWFQAAAAVQIIATSLATDARVYSDDQYHSVSEFLNQNVLTVSPFLRSFAGLGFLSWYLAGKIKVFDHRGHIAKLCIVLLPLLCAALIAISRVDDYWHHWQDVFAGGFLGLVIASFCYLQFFPPPYDIDGWFPHAYLHAMADIRSSTQTTTNPLQSRPLEIETVYVSSGVQHVAQMSDANLSLDTMEAGRWH
ncbi:hypothetical protein ZIOFF_052947 [Zingiber officinale]|uniref:Phosphatidic acid phosphatase type 2/haloperoxidase domain-containing protein n=1 Tax=Zingiber officinale TaxID=94328 RepID=A0A8J5FHW3_ZINOF|nr:hypothetical protein ZIOFF_052947 [Zingiber officinale]